MPKFSKEEKQAYFDELEAYRSRLYDRIEADARKYGFTFKQIESAFGLSVKEKKELSEQWLGYYARVDDLYHLEGKSAKECADELFMFRPSLPDPAEWQEYLEYLRVQKLLSTGAGSTARL